MSDTFVLPKYEAKCASCGHAPGVHTTTLCGWLYQQIGGRAADCDCKGWKRDEGWPPPIFVKADR